MVTPVVATPRPPKIPLLIEVVDGFKNPLAGVEIEVTNFRTDPDDPRTHVTRPGGNAGRANFGMVDPRIDFDIKVRRDGFGPPGNPFSPGDAGVVETAHADGSAIRLVLTRNIALLTVQVMDLTTNAPLPLASVGIDGRTGNPMPLSNGRGLVWPVDVPVETPIRYHAEKANYGPLPGGTPFNQLVEATRSLHDGESVVVTLGLHQAPLVSPKIDQAKLLLVAKKPHTKPARKPLVFRIDAPFDGKGTVALTGTGSVRFFDALTAGNEIPTNRDFTAAELTNGFTVFVEGVSGTDKEDDLTLTLTLSGGTKTKLGPAKTTITVVEATLDIFQSRTARCVDPAPLSAAAKLNPGRFVHVQVGGFHGRAKLMVKLIKPDNFSGTFVLTPRPPAGGAVALFAGNLEVAGGAETALGNPHEFAASTAKAGLAFFAEGRGVSGALSDTGYRLGIKGLDDDIDHVVMTVVQFSKLVAQVPTTPPMTSRANNAVTPDHDAVTIGDPGTDPNAFNEELGFNQPLVLIENSVLAARPVKLSVQVAPAGVPVLWSARRDTRPAGAGDAPAILTLNPAPAAQPTLTGSGLTATLLANSVGTFNVCAYVDCNGDAAHDFNDKTSGLRIDREPFIMLNLVLVRVQGFSNASRAHPENARVIESVTAAGPPPRKSIRAITGEQSVALANPANSGVHNDAVITLIGGGRNGRAGLDQVFAGWVNNVTGMNSVATYVQANPPVVHTATAIMALNTIAMLSPPVTQANMVTRFIGAMPVGLPAAFNASTLAPSIIATPLRVLDVSPFADAGTGGHTAVGTEGAVPPRPKIPVVRTDLPAAGHALAIGQDWRVQMFDSPSFAATSHHPADPLVPLSTFTFNVDFTCDLCVWTNRFGVPGPTTDAACHLYSTVQTNTWHVGFDTSFGPPPAVALTVNTKTITLQPDGLPQRASAAVDSTTVPVEVRFPTGLSMWALDCRT